MKHFKLTYLLLLLLFYFYIYPTTPTTSMFSTVFFDKKNDVVMQTIYPSFRKAFVCNVSSIQNVKITIDTEGYGRTSETVGLFDIILKDNSYIPIKPNLGVGFDEDVNINEFLKNDSELFYTVKIVSMRNIFYFLAFLIGIMWFLKKTAE